MLKIRCAGDGSYHKPVKQLVTKVPAIELVTELIEVLLKGSQGQVPLTHMPDTAVRWTVRRAL